MNLVKVKREVRKKMDSSCIILTGMLLIQMIMTLTMLNPVYDVRKLNNYINNTVNRFKGSFFLLIGAYFCFVIYLGMFTPLQRIQELIFSNKMTDYEKLLLLSRIEKNYIVAGFSLFQVVVLYGVRALLSYTASLLLLTKKSSHPLVQHSSSRKAMYILPNLLKTKRSISYEDILCSDELKEQFRNIITHFNPHNN